MRENRLHIGSFLLCYGASLCSVILDLTDADAICGFIHLKTAYNYYSKRETENTNLIKELKFLKLNWHVRPKSRSEFFFFTYFQTFDASVR